MKEVSNMDIATAAVIQLHEAGSYSAASYLAISILAAKNGFSSKMVSLHYPDLIWANILDRLNALGATMMPFRDGTTFGLDLKSLVTEDKYELINKLILF